MALVICFLLKVGNKWHADDKRRPQESGRGVRLNFVSPDRSKMPAVLNCAALK